MVWRHWVASVTPAACYVINGRFWRIKAGQRLRTKKSTGECVGTDLGHSGDWELGTGWQQDVCRGYSFVLSASECSMAQLSGGDESKLFGVT